MITLSISPKACKQVAGPISAAYYQGNTAPKKLGSGSKPLVTASDLADPETQPRNSSADSDEISSRGNRLAIYNHLNPSLDHLIPISSLFLITTLGSMPTLSAVVNFHLEACHSSLKIIFHCQDQGSVTPSTRANHGTRRVFLRHAES